MEGKGKFIWPDGRSYEGDYLDDKKHGLGTFKWKDGKMYKGQWGNGKQEGEGTLTENGVSRRGQWKEGENIKWLD